MRTSRHRLLSVSAQFTQAATSLLLGMVAVRVLTPADFGRFSIIIATLFLLAGLVTGLVGDSLTVLDRHDARVRGALQGLALVSAVLGGAVAMGVGAFTSVVPRTSAAVVGLAVTVFLLEDSLRRLLMAAQQFGRVLMVDVAYALITLMVLAILEAGVGITFGGIFMAIAAGQSAAILVAIVLLPRDERRLSPRLRGGFRAVLGFGGWRAAQSILGPVRLWAMRVMVASAAGLAATGVLEANRLLLAPVLLSVQGVGAAILVHYSRVVSNDLPRTLRAADRDALTLTFAACGGTLVLVAAAPVLGDVVLGSTALVDRLVMLGWGLVAVGIGATLPYGTLTAVAGAPHRIVVIRTVDVVVSLGCVGGYLALSASADAYRWAPAMVGVFLLGTALLQRRVCRRQLEQARAQESSHHESSAGQVNS